MALVTFAMIGTTPTLRRWSACKKIVTQLLSRASQEDAKLAQLANLLTYKEQFAKALHLSFLEIAQKDSTEMLTSNVYNVKINLSGTKL